MNKRQLHGFTLVEMIVVIVITGIIAGTVAMFLRAPVEGYVASARRAELTDIADTALRRVSRDLHTALPNSVRRAAAGGKVYLEFIPTVGGGRYRAGIGATDTVCLPDVALNDDILDFSAADTCFEVLGTMPTVAVGDQIVVYNMGGDITPNDAYLGNTSALHNRRAVSAVGANSISITSLNALPSSSCVLEAGLIAGGCRFHVVQTPVSYVCDTTAGTLSRWQGYTIQAAQPTVLPGTGTSTTLASNVTACDFTYDASVVAKRDGLVTMHLTIDEQGESVSLYAATHVNNVP